MSAMTPAQLQDTTSLFRTTEEYCVRQDEFLAYCDEHVNPARVAAGLKPLDDRTAREAFRILDKFFMHWRRNGVTV